MGELSSASAPAWRGQRPPLAQRCFTSSAVEAAIAAVAADIADPALAALRQPMEALLALSRFA